MITIVRITEIHPTSRKCSFSVLISEWIEPVSWNIYTYPIVFPCCSIGLVVTINASFSQLLSTICPSWDTSELGIYNILQMGTIAEHSAVAFLLGRSKLFYK